MFSSKKNINVLKRGGEYYFYVNIQLGEKGASNP